MQEREVTAGRKTFPLKRPFVVVATQNPIEHEGTYPLPEAQLDRFMFCVRVGYPDAEEEAAIARTTTSASPASLNRVLTAAEIIELQALVRTVPIADDVVNYAVRLAAATRPESANGTAPPLVSRFVSVGASPRASQQLVLGGKARALLAGRLSVDFADIKAMVPPVFRHRLVLNYRARAEKITTDDVAAELVAKVPEEARK
jgi:MoxR-like ATPase